jgi:hypothetical protein
MPPARLADSWRMRRSPPDLKQWRPAAKLKFGEHLLTANGTTRTCMSNPPPFSRPRAPGQRRYWSSSTTAEGRSIGLFVPMKIRRLDYSRRTLTQM